ncbi:uncharacterized protein BDZ99DRAFT_378049 [Mytilinidion resinicola]|uniref:Zn(2)-C6 fungal-type domain-containing protein n=1 Tax=Mytilinidion resinicola TaxID=574789 RepID=A0A6A6Z2X6_9PEZI|nr:uncharacterized protein BDZ99DRAFT_378049 [Mytilinidion resinicola]KAF2815350.1 hypothetical protein BDZ99DRAFT_378049 [Mytilinidion resinicola]
MSPRASAKSQRVLACVLCQQRKVKCNRKFPCTNCERAGAQCVPATLAPRHRRRRFPERELLERLRDYEGLLRQNNIKFEPLHAPVEEKASPSLGGRSYDSTDDVLSGGRAAAADRPKKTIIKSETVYEANDNGDESDSSQDGMHEAVVKKVWDRMSEGNDYLLFGSRKTNVTLSTLHPKQVQIFRLWQVYLENVNPLLKVTHTPTLQSRIIDAASDVANINPNLEALMFSIYCISVISLVEDKCQTLFGSTRKELLASFRFGCQQALLNCEFLRSSDQDCLTALYLYLISVRSDTDPRSLSSILGAAIRIAQRMGIHNESAYSKSTALEAEMRRRLWWSLIVFDNRICEMSDSKATVLTPAWDCSTPLNVDDFDLRSDMKKPPAVHRKPTEAIFAVVRSELHEFIRHSAFHLDFTNPALKAIAKNIKHGSVPEDGELDTLEKMIEDKYLQSCNLENPLQFMTLWTTRECLAKARLIQNYSKYSEPSVQQTDTDRDAAISHALSMLECDTKLMTSPLTKGYLWLVHMYFPAPAYFHILQNMKKRPIGKHNEKAWEVMSDNYEARFKKIENDNPIFKNVEDDNPIFKVFSKAVLQAWEARQAAFRQLEHPLGQPLEQPRIVSSIQRRARQMLSNPQNSNIEQAHDAPGINVDNLTMPVPMDFGGYGLMYGLDAQCSAGSVLKGYYDIPGQAPMDLDMNQLDWTTMDWNPMHARGC